jgi:O-acetyl-ADP-ribose deacetylase (regulator of RNase III)
VQGDLLRAEVDALVNTVNCVGVMGKGIALQFKQAYPAMFQAYARAARAGEVVPGRIHVYEVEGGGPVRFILNFPTKRHWKDRSRLEDIDSGLIDLVAKIRDLGVRSIAVPPLGAGNGKLDWQVVRPRIVAALEPLEGVEVLAYEPAGAPEAAERIVRTDRPELTVPRALFLRLLDLYTLPRYALTLLEVQRLAYFLQAAGQPLRLRFERGPYGPYASNLNHVLVLLEGHYLTGSGDTAPGTEIQLAAGAVEAAEQVLAGDSEARERLERVGQLIEGFETPFGVELLATVHWVATEDPGAATDFDRCRDGVWSWSERKRRIFKESQLRVAHTHLRERGWMDQARASSETSSTH